MNPKTKELVDKIINHIRVNTPIKGDYGEVTITNMKFVESPDINNLKKQLEMKYSKKGSLKGVIKGRVTITNKKGKVIKESTMHLIPIYHITDRGTYISNGVEKNVLKQMRLKPGAYTESVPGKRGVKGSIMFDNSKKDTVYTPHMNLTFDPVELSFKVEVKNTKNDTFQGVNFLREIGFTDPEINKMLGNNNVSDIMMKESKGRKTINQIYKAFSGETSNETPDKVRKKLFDFMNTNAIFGKDGEGVVKSTLGVNTKSFNKDVLRRSVEKLFSSVHDKSQIDDKEDMRFKTVLNDNDLVFERFERDWNMLKKNYLAQLNDSAALTPDKAINPIKDLGSSVDDFFKNSDIVASNEQTNPLLVASIENRVTQLGGEGGMGADSANSSKAARNPKTMGMNRLDPVDTPESSKVGLVEHLTSSAIVEDKTIKIEVLKVKNGSATISAANTVKLSPDEEYDKKIAFYDMNSLRKDGNKIVFTKSNVPARYQNKNITINVADLDYVDKSQNSMFNHTTNLIPFIHHNDGNRALMGSNMQKQALTLKNREIPLVMTQSDIKGKTFEDIIGEKFGKPVVSKVNGKISKVDDDNHLIVVKDDDGKTHEYRYYNHFPVNQSFITNDLKVKNGDTIKKGQILAEGWQTKDGKLATGINARVGYLPYKGYNYEDGIVISESLSERMKSEDTFEVEVNLGVGWDGGRGSNVLTKLRGYTTSAEVLEKLDSDGVIKVGQKVGPGSIICAYLVPKKDEVLKNDKYAALLVGQLEYIYKCKKIEPTSYVEGEVIRVTVVDSPETNVNQKIVVTITKEKSLKVGDKLSGKHGNKGTVSKIMPDDEMPIAEDGKPLELIFSPLAVPSRKNIGQLLEVNAGLIAEKEGKPFIVNNFDPKEKDRVMDGLKRIGVPTGKMKVKLREKDESGNISEIDIDNPITVGNMYVMKLKHKVDDKIQARSNSESYLSSTHYMPSKIIGEEQGEKHNPQSLGEMEMRSLQSHGAAWNILESSTMKADGGGDAKKRAAIFNAISTGQLDNIDFPATPETLKVMSDQLKILGLNVRPKNNGVQAKSFDDTFDSMDIVHISPDQMIKMIGKKNEITNNRLPIRGEYSISQILDTIEKQKRKFNRANTPEERDKIKQEIIKLKDKINRKIGQDEIREGGILDPLIFGEHGSEESRKKWGYIKLTTPLPNALLMENPSYNPYQVLTGVKKEDLKSMIKGSTVLILDPEKHDYESPQERKEFLSMYKENMNKAGLKPGDIISVPKIETLIKKHGEILWKAGGEGLQYMLDNVDLKQKLKEAEEKLSTAKGKKLDNAYKNYKTLLSMKQNKLKPSDLMIHHVPVAPLHIRPVLKDGNSYTYSDMNILYKKLAETNQSVKEAVGNGFNMVDVTTPDIAANATGKLYKTYTDLTGHTNQRDVKRKIELQGVKQIISSKKGLVRGKMLAKRTDFSGRSVIGVDPNLKLNEVGIPFDMARYLYKPFILKELIKRGEAADQQEAIDMWKANNVKIKRIVDELSEDRPVIVNRQPSLHKFNIQAFKPVIKDTQDGEVVRNIHLNPLVVSGFNADFDGDQMAVHVPISEKAKEEAKQVMMPSNNLINPTNGQMVVEIRHEMALGIYYLTINANKPVGETVSYNSYSKLSDDYLRGKIKARSKVRYGGKTSTAGMILFNFLLPEKYRDFSKPWPAGKIKSMLTEMLKDVERTRGAEASSQEISNLADKIKKLGFEASTLSGTSIGMSDFKEIEGANDIFNKHLEKANKSIPDKSVAMVAGWREAEKEIENNLKKGKILSEDNPLNIMMVSGARAKPDQIRRMMVSVGVGMDITSDLKDPIKNSHYKGLAPQEFWTHSYDSRKGVYDRSVMTSEPGALSRDVWSATQDMVIRERDCKTKDGIYIKKNNKTIRGRFLVEDVSGIGKKNSLVTDLMFEEIYKNENIDSVKVRSPLKCKSIRGVCQMCYGAMPGTQSPPKIGSAIGIIASQSIGEPVSQMTMNTFHSGGTAVSTSGVESVKKILDLKANKANQATIAKKSGVVTEIKKGAPGTYDSLFIDNREHKIPHYIDNNKRLIRVKKGDTVAAGDFLTYGNLDDLEVENNKMFITSANPKDLYELKSKSEQKEGEAWDYAQNYMTRSMENAFTKSLGPDAIDRRHLETVVSKLTGIVKIKDPGGSTYIKGQSVDKNAVDRWNSENAGALNRSKISMKNTKDLIGKRSAETLKDKNGNIIIQKDEAFNDNNIPKLIMADYKAVSASKAPISYDIELQSKGTAVYRGHDNWFSNVGSQDIYDQVARGVALGQTDKLEDPRSRLMTGKLQQIGTGAKVDKAKGNNIVKSMINFFSDKKNLW